MLRIGTEETDESVKALVEWIFPSVEVRDLEKDVSIGCVFTVMELVC